MNTFPDNELCLLIGETIVTTNAFDDAISECVCACLDPQWIDLVYPLVRKLDQQARVTILGQVIERLYPKDDPILVEFRAWLGHITKIRRRRTYRTRRLARQPPDTAEREIMEYEIALMRDACTAAALWRMRLMDRGLAMRLVQQCF